MKARWLLLALALPVAVQAGEGWPGWTEYQRPPKRALSFRGGSGRLMVRGTEPAQQDNRLHLLKNGTSGSTSALYEMAFAGSRGLPRYWFAFSAPDPCSGGLGACDFFNQPPNIADSAICATAMDTGDDWIGACAGMPAALGHANDGWSYPQRQPPSAFTALMIVQASAGFVYPVAIATLFDAVLVGEPFTLAIDVVGQAATASIFYAGLKGDGTLASGLPYITNPAGGQGILAAASPPSSCVAPREGVHRLRGAAVKATIL